MKRFIPTPDKIIASALVAGAVIERRWPIVCLAFVHVFYRLLLSLAWVIVDYLSEE